MIWRAIFVGALVIGVAVSLALIAFYVRNTHPWLCGAAIVVNAGVIVGGTKTVLEIVKLASEIRKVDFDIQKLKLEILEKERAAEKESSRIIIPTETQIERYSGFTLTMTRQLSKPYTMSLLLFCFVGLSGGGFSIIGKIKEADRAQSELKLVLEDRWKSQKESTDMLVGQIDHSCNGNGSEKCLELLEKRSELIRGIEQTRQAIDSNDPAAARHSLNTMSDQLRFASKAIE